MATLDRFSGLLKKKKTEPVDLDDLVTQDMADLAAANFAPDPQPVDESFAQNRMPSDRAAGDAGLVTLPLLGKKTVDQHQRTLLGVLGACCCCWARRCMC